MISNMPTTAETAIISSFGSIVSRFTVFVVVKNARISRSSPRKRMNPPMAILSLCLSGKYGIVFASFSNADCSKITFLLVGCCLGG